MANDEPIRRIAGAACNIVFLTALLCVCQLVLTPSRSLAAVTDRECAVIRKQNAASGDKLFFQQGKAFYSFSNDLSHLAALLKNNPNDFVRFVYLVKFDGDHRSPMISVIQRVVQTNPDDHIKTYNNLRRHPLRISFDEYQKFHHDGDDPVNHHDLMEWFHLGPGLFTNRDFIDTSNWPQPRVFFAIDGKAQNGEEIRSYLLAMKGVVDEGSCVDFAPYVSPSSKRISFIIRDLRTTGTGDYRDPFGASVEFTQ
jgi:hypothetical protein